MTLMSRIVSLFRAPPPSVSTVEADYGKHVLDQTIIRAEKTVERVNRRAVGDKIKAERLVQNINEAADMIRKAGHG